MVYKPRSDFCSDSRTSTYFQPLYFTGGKTKVREVAVELWETSQDQKPGDFVDDLQDLVRSHAHLWVHRSSKEYWRPAAPLHPRSLQIFIYTLLMGWGQRREYITWPIKPGMPAEQVSKGVVGNLHHNPWGAH